ncbi:metallophosphoesterase [Prevotella sp. MA2016]|uniref:metallophosphoesterase n=1 Tax=Prevotella sp. MA2016 TaxID=1408310 RepID=UPI00048C2CB9|nr:metallophosphoesterase [Prevotella sp. MA2016]
MKTMWMMLFLLLPLAAIAYLSWHVWVMLPVSAWLKLLVVAVGVASFLVLFLNFRRAFDSMPLWSARWAYDIGTSSLFVLLYLVMIFLVLDLGRLVRLVPRSFLYHNGYTAIGIFVLMLGVFVYGNLHYNNKVRVALGLKSEKPLPKEYRIVMASDLHIGYHNNRKELARWVDMMNAENPDFILIAGDIIDGSMRPIMEERMAEEFHRLKAPVYACLGNHEFYAGVPEAQQFYKDAGIHLLVDEAAVIDSCIVIIGRDDRTNMRRKPIKDLVKVQSSKLNHQSPYTIVLDHQPYNLDRAEAAGVDFQLSGHTHRGQVWPISWITDRIYECSWGSHQRGNTQYYVSSGIGIWGGKFRIGTQSEYVVATLR